MSSPTGPAVAVAPGEDLRPGAVDVALGIDCLIDVYERLLAGQLDPATRNGVRTGSVVEEVRELRLDLLDGV